MKIVVLPFCNFATFPPIWHLIVRFGLELGLRLRLRLVVLRLRLLLKQCWLLGG